MRGFLLQYSLAKQGIIGRIKVDVYNMEVVEMSSWLGCLVWSLVVISIVVGIIIGLDFFSGPDIEPARKIRAIVIIAIVVAVFLFCVLRSRRKRTEKPER